MSIVWTRDELILPGLIVLAVIAVGLAISYARNSSLPAGLRWLAGILKVLGFALVLLFLLQPERVETFSRPGSNEWAVLIDNSASMTLPGDGERTRGDQVRELLAETETWREQLGANFQVGQFSYDRRARPEPSLDALAFDGEGSEMARALADLRDRYQGRPLAGVLVATDGSPTDAALLNEPTDLPPVFPLLIQSAGGLTDLAVIKATASTNLFEDAPVMIDASLSASGLEGQTAVVRVRHPGGETLEERREVISSSSASWSLRFQVRPETSGTAFFEIEATLADGEIDEATRENNTRLVAANRETGPYRVLYLGGRPNFEHKFLQRALEDDLDVRMTSLIRVARREPKFDFRSRAGERSNPLYRGFEDQEEAERFDEDVFIRLNTKDSEELEDGFPRTAAALFPFDAVVLDDVEADFFSPEQQNLLEKFVTERGGSLLVLGGMESLDAGGYHDTTIGDLLPVYLDPATPGDGPSAGRFNLTRDGRLEPWARLRATESAEDERLASMPVFENVHRLAGVRPGSMAVATLEGEEEDSPALVVRRSGRGHTAVLALTDFWRWGMQGTDERADLEKCWRQMLRWLLSDVPLPLSIAVEEKGGERLITTTLLGEDFEPDESLRPTVTVTGPDGTQAQLSPQPHEEKAGVLQALYAGAKSGAYLADASTRATETRPALQAKTGWAINARHDEFLASQPNEAAMEELAKRTGGRVLTPKDLAGFVDSLATMPLPVSETRSQPLWHSPWWLLLALACFVGEWAIRRWKNLA